MVNKQQVKGAAKQAKGNVKKAVGKATGSKKMQAEGEAESIVGRLQKGFGNLKAKITG